MASQTCYTGSTPSESLGQQVQVVDSVWENVYIIMIRRFTEEFWKFEPLQTR